DPDVSREIGSEFTAAGLTMLDAPISGSPITLERGTASIMVGGDRGAFARVGRPFGPARWSSWAR
ncbi:MAG TPA: NAD(P)-binding domain-containing protein, partial [Acidimicrobiia bacterium]